MQPVVSSPARADTGPPPIPAIASVTGMGIVAQSPVIYGRDGTFSAVIKGRSVWDFGDTSLKKYNQQGKNFIDNSMSWANNLDASNGITLGHDHVDSTGVPTEVLPYLPEETTYNYTHDPSHCTATPCGAQVAMWPGPLIADPADNRSLISYTEIWRIAGQSSWKLLGNGIAVLNADGTITRPTENSGSQYPTLMWSAGETGMDNGWLLQGSTIYAYGCTAGFLIMNCIVGRVALADALNKSSWTYYAGNGVWSSNQSDATVVFQGGAAGTAVFYDAYLGMYVAIYSGVYSNDIYYRVSYTPWGPWSNQTLLMTGQQGWNNNTDYATEAHPEFAQNNGQTEYITYVHITGFLQSDLPLTKIVFGSP